MGQREVGEKGVYKGNIGMAMMPTCTMPFKKN